MLVLLSVSSPCVSCLQFFGYYQYDVCILIKEASVFSKYVATYCMHSSM